MVPYRKKTDFFKNTDNSQIAGETLEIDWSPGYEEEDLFEISNICKEIKDQKEIAQLSKYFKAYREHASYWNVIGICFFKLKRLNEAKLFFNRSMEQVKNYAPALNNLALIEIENRRYNEGFRIFQEALKNKKKSDTIRYNLALLLHKFGHFNKSNYFATRIQDRKFVNQVLKKIQARNFILTGNYKKGASLFSGLDEDELGKDDQLLLVFAKKKVNRSKITSKEWSDLALQENHPYWRLLNSVRGGE
jgi:tetratricopeptide (TPR) repeat protein